MMMTRTVEVAVEVKNSCDLLSIGITYEVIDKISKEFDYILYVRGKIDEFPMFYRLIYGIRERGFDGVGINVILFIQNHEYKFTPHIPTGNHSGAYPIRLAVSIPIFDIDHLIDVLVSKNLNYNVFYPC